MIQRAKDLDLVEHPAKSGEICAVIGLKSPDPVKSKEASVTAVIVLKLLLSAQRFRR